MIRRGDTHTSPFSNPNLHGGLGLSLFIGELKDLRKARLRFIVISWFYSLDLGNRRHDRSLAYLQDLAHKWTYWSILPQNYLHSVHGKPEDNNC